jgi:hypothetical protein
VHDFNADTHRIDLNVTNADGFTLSRSITITVSPLDAHVVQIIIQKTKTNYGKNENVILEANVTGALTAISYAWKDGDTDLGITTKQLNRTFSVGLHTVTVVSTANNLDKSASVDFNVSDWTDFNSTSLTLNNDKVIIQKRASLTDLMWVNESNASKGKCAKIHGADGNSTLFATEFEAAKTFCSSTEFGNFAGLSGWRTPTATELKGFITATIAANILPAYDKKCKKLLALKDNKVGSPDLNNSYTTIGTRYSSNPGVESNMTPNIGLRCVRDN